MINYTQYRSYGHGAFAAWVLSTRGTYLLLGGAALGVILGAIL